MNPSQPDDNPNQPAQQPLPCEKTAVISSRDLLQNSKEIRIVHGDDVYRLRLTRQNKLILTK